MSLSWKPFVWLQREARSEEQDLSSGALTNAWFKDDSVTSQVVYVTVLIRDFVKHQERIAVMARQKDNDDELISEWKSLANRVATMNTALGQLYVYLDTQYRAYLDDTTFWRRKVSEHDVRSVLDAAIRKRLNSTQ